jgi:anti-sigma B factor antagonist
MDANPNIYIDAVEQDGVVVVAVDGEVDLCSADQFARSLATAADSDVAAIVLDLNRVSFMDSAGLHVLLQFSGAERDRLSLTPGSPQVRRLLEVTGVRRYLSFVPTSPPAPNGARPAAVPLTTD